MKWIKKIWRKLFPVEYRKVFVAQYVPMDISNSKPSEFYPELTNFLKENRPFFGYLLARQQELENAYHKAPSVNELEDWSINQMRTLAQIQIIQEIIYLPNTATSYLNYANEMEKKRKEREKMMESDDDYPLNTTFGPLS